MIGNKSLIRCFLHNEAFLVLTWKFWNVHNVQRTNDAKRQKLYSEGRLQTLSMMFYTDAGEEAVHGGD